MRVHANDGLSATAKERLTKAGFQVTTDHVLQDQLVQRLKQERVDVLLVRSANKLVRKQEEAAPAGPSEIELLSEIRDALKK